MIDSFFAALKLVTGEELLAKVSIFPEREEFFIVESPITVNDISIPGFVSGMKIDRWMKISNQDGFVIHKNQIVTILEMDSAMKLFYTKSLQKLIAQENGYDTPFFENDPLKDIRSKLEDLYNQY